MKVKGHVPVYHPLHVSVSGRIFQPDGAQLLEAQVEAVHWRTVCIGGAGMGRSHSSPTCLGGTSYNAALLTGNFLLQHLTLDVTHVQNLQPGGETQLFI